jgi:hypothetical protein
MQIAPVVLPPPTGPTFLADFPLVMWYSDSQLASILLENVDESKAIACSTRSGFRYELSLWSREAAAKRMKRLHRNTPGNLQTGVSLRGDIPTASA